jgi:hypothetical protein
MNRLPLDYRQIFSSWRDLAARLSDPDSPYTSWAAAPGWGEKLSLMKSIIGRHPDVAVCRRCGECCLDFPFACRAVEFLYLLPFIASGWSLERQRIFFEERVGVLRPDGGSLCPFLDPGGCSIYPVRPLICRRAVCGDHICNRLTRDFDSLGHWCGHGAVITQLTVMNLLYYDHGANPPQEMGWAGPYGPGTVRISVAPFELWLLILMGEYSALDSLGSMEGYRPLMRLVNGAVPRVGIEYRSNKAITPSGGV